MLPASGHAGPIPHGYFVHPDTGRVLPEAGNLGYDLQGSTLVPTADFSSSENLGLKEACGMSPQGNSTRSSGGRAWWPEQRQMPSPCPPHFNILATLLEGAAR